MRRSPRALVFILRSVGGAQATLAHEFLEISVLDTALNLMLQLEAVRCLITVVAMKMIELAIVVLLLVILVAFLNWNGYSQIDL